MNLVSRTDVVWEAKQGPIIRVAFSGNYPPGSAGNHIAESMKNTVAVAVREFTPRAVVLDLSDLHYTWGDAICGIVWPLLRDKSRFDFIPSCVVAYGTTAKALAPFMEPRWLLGMAKSHVFTDVEQAASHLKNQLGIQD